MDLIFATGNPNKLSEIREMLGDKYKISSLKELDFTEEIPEPFDSLEENAEEKARVCYETFNKSCFSEDTGLEINALDGKPGVLSARFAGPKKDAEANMEKVLADLNGKKDRTAQFRTVVCLILGEKRFLFEGIVKGTIAESKMGDHGFGYDPIFIPEGRKLSFAQMEQSEKALISHRGRAIEKLVDFLHKLED